MPSTDFGDVAARIAAGLSGVRACLIVSRDGLTLGAYPSDGEERARGVWDLLEQVGEVKRGFVEMGMELWVVSKRGPYAAVVVATPEVKPGMVLDRMDANLVAAEQARSRQAAEEPVAPRPEPVRRPRSPLHPEPRLDERETPPITTEPEPAPVLAGTPQPEDVDEATAEAGPIDGAPVVDLSRVAEPDRDASPEPEPSPQPGPVPAPEPVPEPEGVPDAAPDPAAESISPAPAAAAETPAATVERVPTFRPASTPPQMDDVYVAGVTPAPPSTEASTEPAEEPPVEAPPPPAKRKAGKRGSRRTSGEVDRVALAREFGRLLQDEFGV